LFDRLTLQLLVPMLVHNGAAAPAPLFPKIVPVLIFTILANVTFESAIFTLVTALDAIVVALPVEVTSPVKFALVVTRSSITINTYAC